jgi:hypothetical protein
VNPKPPKEPKPPKVIKGDSLVSAPTPTPTPTPAPHLYEEDIQEEPLVEMTMQDRLRAMLDEEEDFGYDEED